MKLPASFLPAELLHADLVFPVNWNFQERVYAKMPQRTLPDGAIKEALYLAGFAKKLTILHFEEQLGCIAEFKEKLKKAENIEVCLSSRLHAIHGTDQIETLEIKNEIDSSITTIQDPGCQVFIYAGSTPNTELFTELSLEDGYIPTTERMETSIPGVYAAGDIRMKQVRQAATAVSDGAVAAINASM